MTAASVVLFIVVTHGATAPPPDEVVAAFVRALPDGGRPIVRTEAEVPSDEVVAADAATAGAAAVVVVNWEDSNRRADVRVLSGLPDHARWQSRRISFGAADPLLERDRALGLVIASIVAGGPDAKPVAAPLAPVISAPPRPPMATTTAVVSPHFADRGPEPPARLWALEAEVTTAWDSETGLDDALGGTLAVRRLLRRGLAARAGLAFRLTEADDIQLRTRTLMGLLGVAWTARACAGIGALGFGLRADLLGARESARRPAGGLDDQGFWSLGADLVAEGAIGLSAETAVLVGVGGETMFTAADLDVGQTRVAVLPRNRLILQLGFSARF